MRHHACLTALLLAAGTARAQDCLWSQLPAFGPLEPHSNASVFHSTLGRIVCVAPGYGIDPLRTWIYDGAAWTMASGATPTRRYYYSIAYDSLRNRLVLFGGDTGSTLTTDTWEWDGVNWTQVATSGPQPRHFCQMTFDAAHARIVMFGGSAGQVPNYQLFGDTWAWNGSAWTQLASSGPSPRVAHTMTFDPARGRVMLFGGSTSGANLLADLWEWNGTSWTQRPTSAGPTPRSVPTSFLYDTSRSKLILLRGDINNTAPPESWDLDPITAVWTFRATGGPLYNPAAFDPLRARAIIPADDRTWEYNPAASISSVVITQQPVGGEFPVGSTVVLTVAATGTAPLTYAWRRDGIPLVNGGPISGVNEPSLTISPAAPSHSGLYDVVISNACSSVTTTPRSVRIGEACYANCDRSTTPPALNVLDFGCFLGNFAAGSTYANCDHSTNPPLLNVLDFGCFLNAFAAGCS